MRMKNIFFGLILLVVVILFSNLTTAAAPQWNATINFPLNIGNFSEDQSPIFSYNISTNVSDSDGNSLNFSFSTGDDSNPIWSSIHGSRASSFFTWIVLNQTTGLLTINGTINNHTGKYNISIDVSDGSQSAGARIFLLLGNATNDAPQFVGLENKSFNMSSLFEYIINITDEENNIPFNFNINFLNCGTAEWSYRNSTDCTLFNSSQYSTNATSGKINISFTPLRNDVGSYIINFTVTDAGDDVPKNTSKSQIVNFTVLNINLEPHFRYKCDNERNATEDSPFICQINATDIDEINNLTFSANETWFLFNSSTSSITLGVNSTTNFNASALVNFTARDAQVGNWSINISVQDTGAPKGKNSTVFYFFVANINDSVTLDDINNVTAFTSNNYTILVNATDDDLLIPDERVYNESITFFSNNTNVNVSSSEISGKNKTRGTISFNPNDLGTGNHSINISVRDVNNFSISSKTFRIEVLANSIPTWNASTQTNHSLTENVQFYLNLTQNVTDANGDLLNFTFINDTSFQSFSINLSLGTINFTPIDVDVGEHIVTINASDGKTPASIIFNFTISNINDTPSIQTPLTVVNATIDTGNSNINVSEDNYTIVTLWVHDDDVRIPSNQRSFYNESITINLTIRGPNTKLFNFTLTNDFPTNGFPQRVEFDAVFTPNKSDVGSYNITINATDLSNASSFLSFNITVQEKQHSPALTTIGAINKSIIESLYIDVNFTDSEDINETHPGANFSYRIANLTSRGNFLTINSSNGVINVTLNQTRAGVWDFNVSINDTSGNRDSQVFTLIVFDYPTIISPVPSFQFNIVENTSSVLNFSVNSTVGSILNDTLNYTLIINGVVKNSTFGYGNGTSFLWGYTPGFTEETTCLTDINITLNVSNSKLSNFTSWNVTINHTNYPLIFNSNINNINTDSPASLTLSDYFVDVDASDGCQNQTIGFIPRLVEGDALSLSVTNWTNTTTPTITFSSSSAAIANYTITGYEYNASLYANKNATSNNFSVKLTIASSSSSSSSTSSGGGGGGGSSVEKPISLNIIVPEPVSSKKKDRLIIPIGAVNDGEITLNEIIFDGVVAKNGVQRSDLIASFDKSFIDSLSPGERENITLIVDVDTSEAGLFEVTITGKVKSPVFEDFAKVFIQIEKDEAVEEKIIFTEEFIVGNPECAELKELVDEAKTLFAQGDTESTIAKLDDALAACRRAISQPFTSRIRSRVEERLFGYVSFASLAAFLLGFSYYYYKRTKLKRALRGY
ncbi:hypothetical protein HY450_03500 [Candidatus Pacearchaeota archaeon]|nr:hypothetical protein [Candidatus Pacearchaeota archaeon]